jgi:hypothetical protein
MGYDITLFLTKDIIIIIIIIVFKTNIFPLVIFYNNCGTIHILNTNYIQLYKFPDLVFCLLVSVLNVFFSF